VIKSLELTVFAISAILLSIKPKSFGWDTMGS